VTSFVRSKFFVVGNDDRHGAEVFDPFNERMAYFPGQYDRVRLEQVVDGCDDLAHVIARSGTRFSPADVSECRTVCDPDKDRSRADNGKERGVTKPDLSAGIEECVGDRYEARK